MLAMLFEGPLHTYRMFYLNRGHVTGDDFFPTWMGDSIARWEDDTLVVESNGFKDTTWLDFGGHSHSEALRITERYRRRDRLGPHGGRRRGPSPERS